MFTKGLCMLRPCFFGASPSIWSNTCPSLCLTVSSPDELPDPPEGCEFALLSSGVVDGAQSYAIAQWNGASWDLVAIAGAGFTDGEITAASYTTTGSWVVTLNGTEYSGTDTVIFDPAIPSLDIAFINGACQYPMEQITPPDIFITLFFTDISQLAGFGYPVTDPSDVTQWETVTGWTLDSVTVVGNSVQLYPTGTGFVLPQETFFFGNPYLTAIIDESGHIIEAEFAACEGSAQLATIDLPGMITAGTYAFNICGITSANCPALITTGDDAFARNPLLTSINNTVLETIGSGCFQNTSLPSANFPAATTVGDNAFRFNTAITSINLPLITIINSRICEGCTGLVTFSAASATFLDEYAFLDCTSLTTVDAELVEVIKQNAFQNCSLFTSPNFPACEEIESLAFDNSGYINADWPALTTIENTAPDTGIFRNCASFVGLNAPLLTSLGNTAGDDGVFEGISGNTIEITVAAVLETNNGGNPDGDIQYLNANNTLTVNYV